MDQSGADTDRHYLIFSLTGGAVGSEAQAALTTFPVAIDDTGMAPYASAPWMSEISATRVVSELARRARRVASQTSDI